MIIASAYAIVYDGIAFKSYTLPMNPTNAMVGAGYKSNRKAAFFTSLFYHSLSGVAFF